MAAAPKAYCNRCKKTMADTKFYTYKDGTKCELCKACLTTLIDNWDKETYLWILEKFDVPYIEAEWNVLRDRAMAKDPNKMTSMSVIGRYLSKMKLKQWKEYSCADTERLAVEAEAKAIAGGKGKNNEKALEDMKEAFERGEITEGQYKTYAEMNEPEPQFTREDFDRVQNGGDLYGVVDSCADLGLVDPGEELTKEDKIYLAMKWGRLYSASDWVDMEKLYGEMTNTFDIQGAGRVNTLKIICKTSLKMNQAIDSGDIESYQKLSRVYDSMMKSAKFTEAQNKESDGGFIDSVGELVAYCEREGGFIPKYCTDISQDKVDKTLKDMNTYMNSLIKEDSGLAGQIEQYIMQKSIADDLKAEEALKEKGLGGEGLSDSDYAEYYDKVDKEVKFDEMQAQEDRVAWEEASEAASGGVE